ncbi:MAG: ABC transporter permease, partial [Alphaproteobacteria bacterium]|nr:ABC transporter permease [Alphaproteobacteria bacterium]
IYLGILAKSLLIAGLTTLLCLIIGFPVALMMTFASPRGKIWMLLALMSVLRTRGFINTSLESLWTAFGGHFTPLPLLHNGFAVIVGLVYVNLPFLVLPLYTALDRLDRSLIEASLDLGAGHLKTIFNVVVPLAAPGIASGILITLIPALGSYLTPDLMGGADNQMIANVIERQFKRANDWPFGAALSFMLMYLTLIALGLQAWLGRRQEKARARTV